MGYWCTLHLFDDQKFYNELVPKLKGEIGNLESDLFGFFKSFLTGGILHLSEEQIASLISKQIENNLSISTCFDEKFKTHQEFKQIEGYNNQMDFFGSLKGLYEFCGFFQYSVFKYCCDYYPYVILGKGGLMRNFKLDHNTLAYCIISEMDNWNSFLSNGMMGITNWLTFEEVELLYLDKHNLIFEDSKTAEGILNLLEVAYQNKLGFIAGVDMREYMLKNLPQNKLLNDEHWNGISREGVNFKMV